MCPLIGLILYALVVLSLYNECDDKVSLLINDRYGSSRLLSNCHYSIHRCSFADRIGDGLLLSPASDSTSEAEAPVSSSYPEEAPSADHGVRKSGLKFGGSVPPPGS